MTLRFPALALCLLGTLLAGPRALAQTQPFPSKTIHIVVPYPPGGSSDLVARTLGVHLTARLGQPVVVENVPGAAGEIGVASVARRPPDGYTLLVTPNGAISTGRFFKKQPYDALTDLTAIAMVAEIQSVLAVNAALPVSTLDEFIAYAKARPSAVSYSSAGSASAHYLFSEVLQFNAGIKLTPVPYRGAAPAAMAVASGEVGAGVSDLTSFAPLSAAGKIRILATFNRKPPAGFPDVPRCLQRGGRHETPDELDRYIRARQNTQRHRGSADREVTAIFQRADVKETMLKAGGEPPAPMTSEQFSAFIADEVDTLGRQIKAAGLKLE